MLLGHKFLLFPTEDQKLIMFKSAFVARFIYNHFLNVQIRYYKLFNKYIPEGKLRKHITKLKARNHPKFQILNDVSCDVPKQAIKDLDSAFKRFFSKISGFPKFKSKFKSKLSFYQDTYSLMSYKKSVRLSKIGKVKTSRQLPRNVNYKNPRVIYDGINWFLSVAYENEITSDNIENTDISLGVDVGIKVLAQISDGRIFHNINHSEKVKKLKLRYKKFQRRLARFRIRNGSKSKNYSKLKQKALKVSRKLINMRSNYIHQTTNNLVKDNPFRIVVEDISVKDMVKSKKHLSKYVYEQYLDKFITYLEYKCKRENILFVKANKWFPSSQLCSNCGNRKKDLKLNNRLYICNHCNLEIDRDLNAALNLSNYVKL